MFCVLDLEHYNQDHPQHPQYCQYDQYLWQTLLMMCPRACAATLDTQPNEEYQRPYSRHYPGHPTLGDCVLVQRELVPT